MLAICFQRIAGSGDWKPMEIAMEPREPDKCSDSSPDQSHGSNSVESTNRSRVNSPNGPGVDDGREAVTKPNASEWLLSQLQSLLGEINDRGIHVGLFRTQAGIVITLAGVKICKTHKMIHSGEKCPLCSCEYGPATG